MGRIIYIGILAAMGLWAFNSSARGAGVTKFGDFAATMPQPPDIVVPPPSARSGSTTGPVIIGGGPSSGK